MTLLRSIRVGCVIAVALTLNQRLCAQVVETSTTETTGTEATNTQAAVDNIGPIVQTRPDDGTPIAATVGEDVGFGLLRHLRSSVSVITGYNDNVNTAGTGGGVSGSAYTNVNATFSYSTGSPRTRLSLAAGGGYTYYFDHSAGANNSNGYLALSFMHRFTKRIELDVQALVSYQSQPDLSTNLGPNQASGNYLILSDTNSLSYSWTPRFWTITSYTIDAVTYQQTAASVQDRFEQTVGQQARYLLFPWTTIDGEYRFQVINYPNNSPQDSTTNFFLAGFEQRFNPHLNVTFRGGLEVRSSTSNGSGPAPYFDSAINYKFGRRISVSWTNSYSTEESNTVGVPSSATFRTGLFSQIRITRRLSASLALNYVPGGGTLSETFEIAPSASMMINRHLVVNAGYHYTNVSSNTAFGSYSQNIYFAGLNFTF